MSTKKIWIDLATAPDPLFFRPIVSRLQSLGHQVWITARSYGETIAIAEQCNLQFEAVGEHGGPSLAGKASAVVRRGERLARLARIARPDVAVSVNSYSQALATRRCGIPFVTVMDYEHQPANHLAFRLAHRVIVPDGFSERRLRLQGARNDRVVVHPGLKEDVTLIDFVPDQRFPAQLRSLGVDADDILITLRPPATRSAYHRFPNDFFFAVLAEIVRRPRSKVVVLPRYESQAGEIRALGLPSVVIPPVVVDGLNLVFFSDLVVSAGGSMNREAVVLGTPACTVFAGRMAGVDRKLIGEGRLQHLRNPNDLAKLSIREKPAVSRPSVDIRVMELILRTVLDKGLHAMKHGA